MEPVNAERQSSGVGREPEANDLAAEDAEDTEGTTRGLFSLGHS